MAATGYPNSNAPHWNIERCIRCGGMLAPGGDCTSDCMGWEIEEWEAFWFSQTPAGILAEAARLESKRAADKAWEARILNDDCPF